MDKKITILLALLLLATGGITIVMNTCYYKNNIPVEFREKMLLFRIRAHLI
jgi:hypothetical protein